MPAACRLNSAAVVGLPVVNMRRVSLAWVVSLLLVLAQHGALLHQLGHLGHAGSMGGATPAGTTLVADPRALDSGPCLTCEAFAQIANPAAAHVAVIDGCPPALLTPPEPRHSLADCDAPTPRSRGPPQV
jgi:hypothetical protein